MRMTPGHDEMMYDFVIGFFIALGQAALGVLGAGGGGGGG